MRRSLVDKLKDADGSIEDFSTKVTSGTVQLFLHCAGLKSPVPATRLSDGTIRYLCLLAVLCHPAPPPLVCLEEPELGLHPDLLPGLADLLLDASHRMQLIVTTHSDTLVDGLTKTPEAVVVCEKRDGSTEMSRKTSSELAGWLAERLRLGSTLAARRFWGQPLVNVRLYVEGGGNHNKALETRCRKGFSEFIRKSGMSGRMPRIIACGGRQHAFEDFRTAHEQQDATSVPVLLVDGEGPVHDSNPWDHVRRQDGWRHHNPTRR